MNRLHFILIAIVLLSALLRLISLGSIPPHLSSDEAALGYNAYSILKTGRDEHGNLMPIVFKSFGDYKPGLYIYATVPFVAALGLTEWAVRLPSALAGIFTVALIYFFARELFKNKLIALSAAFFLAVSPWHIHFSRGAWEANLALALTLWASLFFLRSGSKHIYIVFSALLFALSLWTYQGAKLSSPIILALLIYLRKNELFKLNRSYLATALLIGIILASPVILSLAGQESGRLKVFSVFSYGREQSELNTFLAQGKEKIGSPLYYLFHSESYNFFRGITGRYFNHFSGRFLFFEGDYQNPRHTIPNHGVLTLIDLVFLLAGIVALARSKWQRAHFFIFAWLLLSPLPSVLSRDQVHAVRALNMVVPLTTVFALGFVWLIRRLPKPAIILILLLYATAYIYFLDSYFIHMPAKNSRAWNYGYKQIVQAMNPIQDEYKTVRIQQSFDQPYIYFLFFGRYDPASYQLTDHFVPGLNPGDVGKVEHLDNIYFGPIDWSINRYNKDTLFVADIYQIPQSAVEDGSANLILEVLYPDRETAFRIVDVKT